MAESSSLNLHLEVSRNFREHCRGPRIGTATVVLDLLRQHYPNHHVTETTANNVSLLEFAAAGFATCTLMLNDFPDCTRKWIPNDAKPDGDLKDDGRFACYRYIWENVEYVVYQVVWRDSYQPPYRMFYILKEGGKVDSEGHCEETDVLVRAVAKWTSQLHQEVFVFDDGCWMKSKPMWKAVQQSSWDNVILDPNMKEQLMKDVHGFFDSEQSYAELTVPWKRGIILYGSPGNGKTATIKTLAKALSGRTNPIPLLYVKSFEPPHGETEQSSIRSIFRQARHSAPCLLIFEDLDSLVNVDVRSYFLNEVDGLESNHGVLMVASANDLLLLDPAIVKRPSRFDRKYEFKLPGKEARIAYAKMWMKRTTNTPVHLNKEICDLIGGWTEGFSFAYLQELFTGVMTMVLRGTNLEDADAAIMRKETATCQCDKVCPKCEKPYGKNGGAEKEVAQLSQNIPGHLVDNVVVKCFGSYVSILREQMSEKDPPMASKEEGNGNVQSPRKHRKCC